MYTGFILSSSHHVQDNVTRLVFQGRLSDGRRFHWTVTQPGVVFFIDRYESWTPPEAIRKSVTLKNLRGIPVDALYFANSPESNRARKACEARDIPTYEADVHIVARFLMERFIKGGVSFKNEPVKTTGDTLYFIDPVVQPSDYLPRLKLLSIDIECSPNRDLFSIALFGKDMKTVLMIDENPGTDGHYLSFNNETALLLSFFQIVQSYDPDAFIGWNLIGFDLQWLSGKCKQLGIPFNLGLDGLTEILSPGEVTNLWVARIPGRAALDGIPMVRSAYIQTEGYSLGAVAATVLGSKKTIESSGLEKVEEIIRIFHQDKESLAEYNIQDARLVFEIFDKLNLAQLALRRSQLTGLPLDRVGGSVAAFDFLYLPRLHRKGFVADTYPQSFQDLRNAPGGLVLESTPGLFQHVAVFDFKSLYPSIILTFKIDPLAANVLLHPSDSSQSGSISGRIIKGPAGLEFAEEYAVLPVIIDELWQARDQAKRLKDATLSQAVKIIMNSFYGVLGSPGCRFYDPRLAGSITRIGHWIMKVSREFIEKEGYPVIYGDTDSLFIHLGEGRPKEIKQILVNLAGKLNNYLNMELKTRFHVESKLDVEFEKLFLRFFMPTIRGQTTGSKKRYAGLFENENGDRELFFAGLESTRRDWTDLAKDFQSDLFNILFSIIESSVLKESLRLLVRTHHRMLYAGELDDKLVYKKGISKRLDQYKKNVPPHVRAARMLDRFEGRIVSYVMTTAGPEPIQKRSTAAYDYDHYSKKQLAPVADMILQLFDMDYRSVIKNEEQLPLF